TTLRCQPENRRDTRGATPMSPPSEPGSGASESGDGRTDMDGLMDGWMDGRVFDPGHALLADNGQTMSRAVGSWLSIEAPSSRLLSGIKFCMRATACMGIHASPHACQAHH